MSADVPPEQSSAPFEFETRLIQDGYSYWRSKGSDARLPRRADINPIEIPQLMPHAILLDVRSAPSFDFRYRLIGTYVAEHLHSDHTGAWFSEIAHQKPPSQIWENCKQVAETGSPLHGATPYVGPHEDYRRAEDIILPLAEDGTTVDTLLVFVMYLSKSNP